MKEKLLFLFVFIGVFYYYLFILFHFIIFIFFTKFGTSYTAKAGTMEQRPVRGLADVP